MDVSASTPDRVDSESMCLALGRYLPSHNETMEWMTEGLRRRETSPMTKRSQTPAWAIPRSVSGAEIVFFIVSGLAVGIVAGGVQPRLLYVSGRSPCFVPTP